LDVVTFDDGLAFGAIQREGHMIRILNADADVLTAPINGLVSKWSESLQTSE
jgi:hypothetical protein